MQIKTVRVLLIPLRWIQRLLDVRLPMDAIHGVRSR
jgi:hypothetical protein